MLSDTQGHVCPVCDSSLHSGERLQRHHITERFLGGKDTFGNLLLLHSICHRRVHYGGDTDSWRAYLTKFKVAHPRSAAQRPVIPVNLADTNNFREDFGFMDPPEF